MVLRAALAALVLCAALLAPLPAHAGRWHSGWFFVTGYVATGFRTASGVWPIVGRTVAVDTRYFRFGTWLRIDGIGWRRAEDTGGAIIGNRLDVFTASVGQAYAITGWRKAYW